MKKQQELKIVNPKVSETYAMKHYYAIFQFFPMFAKLERIG